MPKEARTAERKPVLIVEDSQDFSNLMRFVIEDLGLEAVQAPVDADDIVSLAKEHKPVTILMDLALRRKSGMQFIGDLKADPETRQIPIIIITGRELPAKDVFELQMRGVKYLRKGRVEMDEIKAEILDSAKAGNPSSAAPKTP
ncbi:MAG: response regulator [Bacteroidota bacterium]